MVSDGDDLDVDRPRVTLLTSFRRTEPVARLLVLLGLTGFAISQPLLSILGDNPTTLAFYGVDGLQLLVFTLALAFLPPCVLWVVGTLAWLASSSLGRIVHLASVAVLVGIAAIQVLKQAGIVATLPLALLGVVVAVAGATAYVRFAPVRTWLQLTAILPFLALAGFVFTSESSDLLRVDSASTAHADEDTTGNAPSVVFVLLDEFPTQSLLDGDGRIDAIRFPRLAGFAEEATWYRHYTSQVPFTNQALPTILTGRAPKEQPPLWTNYPENLFSLLAPTHDLHVSESLTRLCGLEACTVDGSSARIGDLMRRTFGIWEDRVIPGREQSEILDDFTEELDVDVDAGPDEPPPTDDSRDVPASGDERLDSLFAAFEGRPARVSSFVEGLVPGRRPSLHFLHLMLPHLPYRYYPSGQTYSVPVADSEVFSVENAVEWLSALSEQRHLMQAGYADKIVGLILDELKAKGLYRDSLIIVSADHGASFVPETNYRELEESTIGPIAYAPLFVKAPGQTKGRVDDANLMSIDIVPTIADVIGIDLPWDVEGAPAGSAAIRQRGSEKYFYDFTRPFAPRLEGIVRFDSDEALPEAADRWIAPATSNDPWFSGLIDHLELTDMVNRPMDEIITQPAGGVARISALDALVSPPQDAPPGLVVGTLDGAPDGTVLVAVNGTVVSGSEIYDHKGKRNAFAAPLPESTLASSDNDIRVAIVTENGAVELRVVGT
jgi:hypothetical protein